MAKNKTHSKLKLKLKGSGKKRSKTNSSSKSQSSSSTRDITSRFSPDDRFHLVTEEQGETQVYSFSSINDLQIVANQRILAARKSDIPLYLWCFEGIRCPISAGPIPRAMIEQAWVPLVDDFSVSVDECPPSGLIVGETGPAEGDEDISHLDTDTVPDEDDDGGITIEGATTDTEDADSTKVLQIFNQGSGPGTKAG